MLSLPGSMLLAPRLSLQLHRFHGRNYPLPRGCPGHVVHPKNRAAQGFGFRHHPSHSFKSQVPVLLLPHPQSLHFTWYTTSVFIYRFSSLLREKQGWKIQWLNDGILVRIPTSPENWGKDIEVLVEVVQCRSANGART